MYGQNSLKAKGNSVNSPSVSVATDWGLSNSVFRRIERVEAKINVTRIPTKTYAVLGWAKDGLRKSDSAREVVDTRTMIPRIILRNVRKATNMVGSRCCGR